MGAAQQGKGKSKGKGRRPCERRPSEIWQADPPRRSAALAAPGHEADGPQACQHHGHAAGLRHRRDLGDDQVALAEELMAFARANLSHVKSPRRIDFMAELPRHPTGKLYKRLIRDAYWGKGESRIV